MDTTIRVFTDFQFQNGHSCCYTKVYSNCAGAVELGQEYTKGCLVERVMRIDEERIGSSGWVLVIRHQMDLHINPLTKKVTCDESCWDNWYCNYPDDWDYEQDGDYLPAFVFTYEEALDEWQENVRDEAREFVSSLLKDEEQVQLFQIINYEITSNDPETYLWELAQLDLRKESAWGNLLFRLGLDLIEIEEVFSIPGRDILFVAALYLGWIPSVPEPYYFRGIMPTSGQMILDNEPEVL